MLRATVAARPRSSGATPGSVARLRWPPRVVQSPPVQGDGDEDQSGQQHQVGVAPAEPVVECGGQGREHGAGQAGDQGQRGQRPHAAVTAPAGQCGEGGRVQGAGHRDPGQHPAEVEHGQVRGQRDGRDARDGDERGGGHHLAGAEVVDVSPDPDPDPAGDELGQRERTGDGDARPAGVGGDGGLQGRERVVQASPRDDLDRAEHRDHAPQPGAVKGAGLHGGRLGVGRGVSHRRQCLRDAGVTGRGGRG